MRAARARSKSFPIWDCLGFEELVDSSRSHEGTQRSTIRAAVLYRLERNEWLRMTSKFGFDNASRRGMHIEGLRASHTNTLTIRVPWERYVHACQTMKIATTTLP